MKNKSIQIKDYSGDVIHFIIKSIKIMPDNDCGILLFIKLTFESVVEGGGEPEPSDSGFLTGVQRNLSSSFINISPQTQNIKKRLKASSTNLQV